MTKFSGFIFANSSKNFMHTVWFVVWCVYRLMTLSVQVNVSINFGLHLLWLTHGSHLYVACMYIPNYKQTLIWLDRLNGMYLYTHNCSSWQPKYYIIQRFDLKEITLNMYMIMTFLTLNNDRKCMGNYIICYIS